MHLSPILSSLLPTRHGFFTRNGGVSSEPYHHLNTSYFVGDNANAVACNRSRIMRTISKTTPLRLFIPHQVHGKRVCTIYRPHAWNHTPLTHPRADALVTNHPNIAVGVTTADCVPILLIDPTEQIIAAIHGGWRSIVAGIIFETIRAMEKIGAKIRHILAAIGPCIAPLSYPVGLDLVAKLSTEEQAFVCIAPPYYYLDLPALTRYHLLSCGLVDASVCLQAHKDTYQNDQLFFSSRRSSHLHPPHSTTRKPYGCQAAVISLLPK